MDDNEKAKVLQFMAKKLNRSVRMYLDNCTRCGTCIEACHAYVSLKDLRYTPVGRAQTIRRLYDNYHTLTGKVAPC